MRYITYEQAAEIPAFQGKRPAEVAGLVADATLLWRYINSNAWATDPALQAFALEAGLDADRVNDAMGLLRDTQRVFGFDDTPLAPPPAVGAPAVIEQMPMPGSTVPRDTAVYARVSQALDASTVKAGSLVVASPAGPVRGTCTYDEATLRVLFTPAQPLAAGQQYACTLSSGIKNGSGVPLPNDVTWEFATAA